MSLRQSDVGALTLLGAAAKQDNQYVAVLPEVYAVTRPEINPVLGDEPSGSRYSTTFLVIIRIW